MVMRGQDIDCLQLVPSEVVGVWGYQGTSFGMDEQGAVGEGKIKVGVSFAICGEDPWWRARRFSATSISRQCVSHLPELSTTRETTRASRRLATMVSDVNRDPCQMGGDSRHHQG